jgi:hypothetical protein
MCASRPKHVRNSATNFVQGLTETTKPANLVALQIKPRPCRHEEGLQKAQRRRLMSTWLFFTLFF